MTNVKGEVSLNIEPLHFEANNNNSEYRINNLSINNPQIEQKQSQLGEKNSNLLVGSPRYVSVNSGNQSTHNLGNSRASRIGVTRQSSSAIILHTNRYVIFPFVYQLSVELNSNDNRSYELSKEYRKELFEIAFEELVLISVFSDKELHPKIYEDVFKQEMPEKYSGIGEYENSFICTSHFKSNKTNLMFIFHPDIKYNTVNNSNVSKLLFNIPQIVIVMGSYLVNYESFFYSLRKSAESILSFRQTLIIITQEEEENIDLTKIAHPMFRTIIKFPINKINIKNDLDKNSYQNRLRPSLYQVNNTNNSQFRTILDKTITNNLQENKEYSLFLSSDIATEFLEVQLRNSNNNNVFVGLDQAIRPYLLKKETAYIAEVNAIELPCHEKDLKIKMNALAFKTMTNISRNFAYCAYLRDPPTNSFKSKAISVEEAIYEHNNQLAQIYNEKILENLYDNIIVQQSKRDDVERTPLYFENKFTELMDIYGRNSLEVSSQLQTFNKFMEKKRIAYIKDAVEILKDRDHEEEHEIDLKEKIRIQSKVLTTLEKEVDALENKRKIIEDENLQIKKLIRDIQKQNILFQSNSRPPFDYVQSNNPNNPNLSLDKHKSCACCLLF